MTQKDFFDGFRDFLLKDPELAKYSDCFTNTIMDNDEKYNMKMFTKEGFRLAKIFFEESKIDMSEFYFGQIEWARHDMAKIKQKMSSKYDTVMYVGRENCDRNCNFFVASDVFKTEVELCGDTVDDLLLVMEA